MPSESRWVIGPTRGNSSFAIAARCSASHSAFPSYEVTLYVGPASGRPGNPRARPRTSARKVRRTLVLFPNIATPASHDIPEDKDPERVTFLSMRDRRGPDLALERDHEGRPDERGNTCPAPTRLR